MSDFETALKKTLEERTASSTSFAAADLDLHQICAEAGRAVKKLTDGLATLQLIEIPPGSARRAYTLDFVTEDENRTLCGFALTTSGYPISVFSSLEQWELMQQNLTGWKSHQLVDRSAVEGNVKSLAKSDSQLLPLVEFVLRNRDTLGEVATSGI